MEVNFRIGRIFQGYSLALSQGIKPISSLYFPRGVHTRLETNVERLNREKLERAKAELDSMRNRQKRQERNARIARNICALVRNVEMEAHKRESRYFYKMGKQWLGVSTKQEAVLEDIAVNVLNLVDASLMSRKNLNAVTQERNATQALLARERELTKKAESRRQVELSSLRDRYEKEKEFLFDEIQELRDELQKRDKTIAQLNEYCEETVQQIDGLDRQIALYESSEAMNSFSREVSCTISEMSEVILPRNGDQESVQEKMRDLRDGIRDLVREVKSRRQHSQKMTEQIYTLEEHRLMWSE